MPPTGAMATNATQALQVGGRGSLHASLLPWECSFQRRQVCYAWGANMWLHCGSHHIPGVPHLPTRPLAAAGGDHFPHGGSGAGGVHRQVSMHPSWRSRSGSSSSAPAAQLVGVASAAVLAHGWPVCSDALLAWMHPPWRSTLHLCGANPVGSPPCLPPPPACLAPSPPLPTPCAHAAWSLWLPSSPPATPSPKRMSTTGPPPTCQTLWPSCTK